MDIIVESPEFDGDVPFPAPVALDIIMQLAEALKFLRIQRVMHRDIKAKNILVNDRPLLQSSAADTTTRIDDQHHGRKQLQYYLVKLTDMGLSQYKLPQNSTSASKMKGATNWRAPEVFAENTSTYNWAADVYSFAMACYEIVSGKTPFYDVKTITYKRLCQATVNQSLQISSEDVGKLNLVIDQTFSRFAKSLRAARKLYSEDTTTTL
jgi:serine/threonine protein kinase